MDIINVAYEPLSIINDLSSIAFSRIGTKDIEFTIDVEPDMPQLIFGDNVRIHQILLNLITNAIKFTQQGEVHLAIEYDRVDDENVIMKASVNDTGMGIKPQDIEKLFRSFKQVDSKRNRNIEGTGLGLAICKQLLDLMGGKISVKSEFGKGSSFFFEVPQKIIDKTPAIPPLTKNVRIGLLVGSGYVRNQLIKDIKRVSATPVTLSTIDNLDEINYDQIIVEKAFFTDSIRSLLEKHPEIPCTVIGNFGSPNDIDINTIKFIQKPVYSLGLYNALGFTNFMLNTAGSEMDDFTFVAPEARVLIVDDNAVNLTVAKGLIEPLRMQVDTAESAAQAIEMVCNIKYDLIFMDHMMPEVDGVEATHIIRRMLPSYNETPIIALTANAVSGAKEMFLSEGMNDFVAKPIEISDIVAKLRKWLPQDKIMPADKFNDNKETETPASEMPSLKDIEVLNTEKAISMLGSEKLYWTVLREYYSNIGKNSQSIQDHFDKEEWSEYTIEVHALKSASRQIGAEELGEHAFELEMAGKENNIDLIKQKTGAMLDEYKSLTELLAPMFPDLADVKKGYADRMTISDNLEKLKEAIGDFDILCIDEVIEQMGTFEYHKTCMDYFEKLKAKIEESDFDSCIEIMDDWLGCIEKCEYFSKTPADVTLSMLKTLQTALNNFDMEKVNNALEELSKNQYPQKQQDILDQIKGYVSENAVDNCFELVTAWRDILK
jgi:CheY-like chemotaxis protein/HPt (histidine-containing phosphotransfer) domain-containing protein